MLCRRRKRMNVHIKKIAKIIIFTLVGFILLLFALSCLFGIIFFGGMAYQEFFM